MGFTNTAQKAVVDGIAVGRKGIISKDVDSVNILTAPSNLLTVTGEIFITDITLETDATGLATGTNIEIKSDEAVGAVTQLAEAVANLGANKVINGSAASVTAFVGHKMTTGSKLQLGSTGANCDGAGSIRITIEYVVSTAGTTVA